jgi:hypothetical protein
MLAWDTLAVVMAGYESAEKNSVFIDLTEYTTGQEFSKRVYPDPHVCSPVLQQI